MDLQLRPVEPETYARERSLHLWIRHLYGRKFWVWLVVLVVSMAYLATRRNASPFKMVRADQEISGATEYPVAAAPNLVGSYPPQTKSGAGYFYDDVLEYRVWMNPERGAEPLNGGSDYFQAFAQYERAKQFADNAKGAEQPVVLIRQREWISEPEPGKFIPEKGERITEWRVKWLTGNHRDPNSIQEFMKHPRKAAVETDNN